MTPLRYQLALAVALLGSLASLCAAAQAVVVHTVDAVTGKSLANVPVTLRYNQRDGGGPKADTILTTHSSSDGRAVFKHVHLSGAGFRVSVASKSFAPDDPEPIFLPAGTPNPTKGPAISTLPAEVTIRCRQRSLSERLLMIAKGP